LKRQSTGVKTPRQVNTLMAWLYVQFLWRIFTLKWDFTLEALVSITGILLSTGCAQDTSTCNYFLH